MDKVFIEELCVLATIGVYDWEKRIKQRLVLNLSMDWDNHLAAAKDDLSYALNYAAVSDAITHLVSNKPYGLIETVAERVADFVMDEFGVSRVSVTVRKPGAIVNASSVGVSIERSRSNA